MDDKSRGKSRRELRKEARLVKNKKKFDSWIEHRKSHKMDCSRDSNSKNLKKSQTSSAQIPKEKDVSESYLNYEQDHSSKHSAIPEKSEVEFHSLGFHDSTSSKAMRKKDSKRNTKTKFEEYLEMEMKQGVISAEEDLELERKLAKKLKVKDGKLKGMDHDINMLFEGIPSVLELVDGEAHPVSGEISKKRTKQKKIMSLEKEPEGGDEMADETVGLFKQAKKLKVKEGKLQGDDDGINLLIEGTLPDLKSFESEVIPNEDATRDDFKNNSLNKKCKKLKTTEHQQGAGQVGYPAVVLSETRETASAEVVTENTSSKALKLKRDVKYIAPHLRSRVENELEEHSQIRRRVRGLLNRMSESNVESITGEISAIFQSVARGISSRIIIEEVLASCSGGPRGNEQYAAVFAAFVAGMACLVGIDFGAKLLASLAKCFEVEYLEEDNLSLRNLTLLLSYLYIFGVCSSDLIYDFMIMLSKRLMEVDVSTILTILQCCGMNLRGDDPVAMKNFVLSVQTRANELKVSSEEGQGNKSSKRMEFMLETICDIKNNKKRAKEDTPQHTRVKKWLQKLRVENILVRGLKWSKLLDPDKKGQWWLSGDLASVNNNVEEVAGTIDKEALEAQKMLQLAAAQRMNTDVRRAIFCVIMSGEDYIDAFEKLLRLDLQGKQDREIMRVLVECCLQEKVFNKYYSVLATKICSHDKKHKVTLQYCIWDHYKEVESMVLLRSMHLSKFVAEMISSFTLSLAVLKSVDLSDIVQLTPKRIMHFRMLFEAIFEYPDSLVWNIFTRIAANPEYESLRDGVQFFINKYVVNSKKSTALKFKIAKKALANVEGILM